MAKLDELIKDRFKFNTRPNINPLIDSLGTTPEKVFDNNPDRVALVIVNLSSNNIYLGFTRDVSANKGIIISPNGGSFSMVYDEDFHAVGWEIWGVASGLNSPIYCIEILAY